MLLELIIDQINAGESFIATKHKAIKFDIPKSSSIINIDLLQCCLEGILALSLKGTPSRNY